MNFLKTYACIVGLLVLLGGTIGPVQAQNNPRGGAGVADDEAMEKFMAKQIASQIQIAEARINAHINALERAVGLSEQQAVKLRVACKGALNSYESKVVKDIKTQTSKYGVEFAFSMDSLFGVPGNAELENIWTSAIKSVLTDSQVTKLEKWNADRKAYRQSAAVSNFVARVDKELFLEPEQRKQLVTAINGKYGELLAGDFGQPHRFTLRNAAKIDTSLVDEILSESQVTLWKKKFAIELLNLEEKTKAQK